MRRFSVLTVKFQADEFAHGEGLVVWMSTSTVYEQQSIYCVLMMRRVDTTPYASLIAVGTSAALVLFYSSGQVSGKV